MFLHQYIPTLIRSSLIDHPDTFNTDVYFSDLIASGIAYNVGADAKIDNVFFHAVTKADGKTFVENTSIKR